MGPISAYSLLFQLFIVLLSMWHTRLQIIKDWSWGFWLGVFFSFVFTIIAYEGVGSNPMLALFFAVCWALMLSYTLPKVVAPKMNEAFVYVYTLYFWYVLGSDLYHSPKNWFLYVLSLGSIYPSYLIIKACFSNQILTFTQKTILYIWLLVCIVFCYVNEVFWGHTFPFMAVRNYSFIGLMYTAISAVQVYFVAIILSLLFISNPMAHLERNSSSLNIRWKDAKYQSKKLIQSALLNFINFQISTLQWLYITLGSIFIFYLDAVYDAHSYTLLLYTFVLPLVFFYVKWSPEDNTEFVEE